MPHNVKVVRWETYTRPTVTGRALVYVRAIDRSTGKVLLTRSSGGTSESAAREKIAELSSSIDFDALIEHKTKNEIDLQQMERDRLGTLTIFEFLTWFWSSESPYLVERREAKRPLSASYLETSRVYLSTTIAKFSPFRETSVQDANYFIIEAFIRKLRQYGKGRDVIDRSLETVRRPLNWAMFRKIVTEPFRMGDFVLPERDARERGLLTDAEAQAFLALPVAPLWVEKESGKIHISIKGRSRLKNGMKNEGIPPQLDIRQKAAVALALFAGLRRGEILGLRWGDIDLERRILHIQHNYVKKEDKSPKCDSMGRLPITVDLENILRELHSAASLFHLDGDEDFALMNPTNPHIPVSEITIKRAWSRTLGHIGIDEIAQKQRNLVLHGARHRFVTTLLDSGMTPSETAKMSRHKELSMLDRYGGHLQDETIEKARTVLNATTKPKTASHGTPTPKTNR
jgi:integrase